MPSSLLWRLRGSSALLSFGPIHRNIASKRRYMSIRRDNTAHLSRWYDDLRLRIGKCIMFGCSHAQIHRAAMILRALASEWRTLAAGSGGFLTGTRRGLEAQAVVWGEMDSFQHVNNTAYIRYAEASRVNWITHFAGHDTLRSAEWRDLMSPQATGLIMKTIKADYKFPVVYPDRVSAYHKLSRLPVATDTSLSLECIILSHRHRRIAARTEEDVVVYDYRLATKTSIPPFVLDVLQDTWEEQQLATRRASKRIWELIDEVRSLETETWDCEDATEDIGAASEDATA